MYDVVFQEYNAETKKWENGDTLSLSRISSIENVLYQDVLGSKIPKRCYCDNELVMKASYDEVTDDVLFTIPSRVLNLYKAEVQSEFEQRR